jgi:tetratricopeptide (TPR) repeat protein
VRRFLADEPVAAYPEPISRRAARWARRHRQLVVGSAALLVTAVVALTVGTLLLRQKQSEIERQRTRAEKNFGIARSAVDRYFTRVSESPDLKARGLETLRGQLLETARGFYERLAQEGANAPGLRDDLAEALMRLGDISRTMAENDKSDDAYRRSIEIYDQLLKSDPGNLHYREQLASAWGDLALVHVDTSRAVDAEAAFKRSVEIRRQTPPGVVRDPEDLSGESNSLEGLGILYQNTARIGESEAALKESLELRQRVANETPNDDTSQRNLAQIHLNLGVLYAQSNRLTDAERELSAVTPIADRLVRAHADEPEYQNLLAASYGNLAGVYMLVNRLDDARESYRREMDHRQTLAQTHPLVTEYVLFLGSGYTNLGELEVRDNRAAQGLPWFDKAIDTIKSVLAREPRHAVARHYLSYTYSWRAKALDAVGRYADAMNDCDRAIEFDDQQNADLRRQREAAAAKAR